MNYLWTTLQVKNMDESIEFYRDVIGLALNERHPAGPGTELAFLGSGDTKVELVCSKDSKFDNTGGGITLGFGTDSLEKTMETLKANKIEFDSSITSPNPHVKFFFAKDPNGVLIQFVYTKL